MAPFNYILFVTLTYLLLVSNVLAQGDLLPLDATLRRSGLDRWADFLLANPHPIYTVSGIVAFAPINSAVDAYLSDRSIVLLTGNSEGFREWGDMGKNWKRTAENGEEWDELERFFSGIRF
ncbi:hypothetical protein BDZ91DRAFT_71389 [Kalaharituber pfeilii]|nr:hypothetical protein BDZ91DRAFT_71389 [Kalaharituber pfeilii]